MSNIKFYLASFIFKIKPALKHEMGKDLSHRILNRMKFYYAEIDNRKRKEKGIMAFHRIFLIMGLSLYRALEEEFGKTDGLVEKIHNIIWEGRTKQITGIAAFIIRHSKNPYNLYLYLLGPKNDRFFPCPPWEKVEINLENGNGWHQHKCPYYNFFKDEGVVELTDAYCDLDRRIAELVPDHIELKRKRTLAKGNDMCDFYYYKK